MAPLRTTDYVEYCDEDGCETEAAVACLRCDRPLCIAHAPADDQRCGPCEAHFAPIARAARRTNAVERFIGWLGFVAMTAAMGGTCGGGCGLIKDLKSEYGYYEYWAPAAGITAILFGLVGVAVGAAMFVDANDNPMCKLPWRQARGARRRFLAERPGDGARADESSGTMPP